VLLGAAMAMIAGCRPCKRTARLRGSISTSLLSVMAGGALVTGLAVEQGSSAPALVKPPISIPLLGMVLGNHARAAISWGRSLHGGVAQRPRSGGDGAWPSGPPVGELPGGGADAIRVR